MSHDLFAAFETASISKDLESKQSQSGPGTIYQKPSNFNGDWTNTPSLGNNVTVAEESQKAFTSQTDEDDDDFGDFEDASVPTLTSPQGRELPQGQSKPGNDASERRSEVPSGPVPSSRKTHYLPKAPRPSQPAEPAAKQAETGRHPFADHMDLLFEAGDDEYDAGADELGDLASNPEAAMAYSKRIIAEQEAAHARTQSVKLPQSKPIPKVEAKPVRRVEVKHQPNKLKKKSGYAPASRNAEVLFDADNVSEHAAEDDDFGDFEDWNEPTTHSTSISKSSTTQQQVVMPAMDLLGLEEAPKSTNGINGSSNYKTSPERRKQGKPHDLPSSTIASQETKLEDDSWDDFETSVPQSPTASASGRPTSTSYRNTRSAEPAGQPDLVPPSNVPPPILLLSLFPPLFSSADDALFDTMAKLELKQRQALLAHPASHQFLRGYLGHCTVLAHIIAGRKLRWKRDQRLSQSMRIGPAAAGGKGGMKLTGLDKTEVAKEDREVVDVLRLWKGQVGKLRTAVTAASAAPGLPKLPPVPEIAEQMPVKTLKPSEGGVTAVHACALCGLRREERVARVDLEVEDSFGEWWVQGLNMHVACKKFWEDFEKKLKSR